MNQDAYYSEPMLLHFDSYENRIAKGKIQTVCYRNPFQFDSMDHLFMIMDDILDAVGFPRREGFIRHLEEKDNQKIHPFQKIKQEDYIKNRQELTNSSRFHGQMTVIVRRREHSSMQGTVAIGEERKNFRSALELMHMFHEYLENRFDKKFV